MWISTSRYFLTQDQKARQPHNATGGRLKFKKSSKQAIFAQLIFEANPNQFQPKILVHLPLLDAWKESSGGIFSI